jgi:WD40-like Beta Propeller Repeat
MGASSSWATADYRPERRGGNKSLVARVHGNQVVFEWDKGDGEPHIYIKFVGLGDPVRLTLTSASGAEYGPAWSRDGRQIAFLRKLDESNMGVFVIPALGGELRSPTWLPAKRGGETGGAAEEQRRKGLGRGTDPPHGGFSWAEPLARSFDATSRDGALCNCCRHGVRGRKSGPRDRH